MKSINPNTIRVAELAVQLATIIATGVKTIIGIFKRRKKDDTENVAEPQGDE